MAREREANPSFAEPRGDVFETKKEVVVTLDLRGAQEDSIVVDAHDMYVIIEAKKAQIQHEKEEQSPAIKRIPYDYRLMLDLPSKVKPATMKKTFLNGVLEIRLQKVVVKK